MNLKSRMINVAAAVSVFAVSMGVCAEAAYENNVFCQFEDYMGGDVQVVTPAVSSPWKSSVTFGGRTTALEKVSAEKGTSLWFKTDGTADSYLFGAVADESVTTNTIFEFDVKPLGKGSKPLITSIWGNADSADTQNQNMWTVYPNGEIGIYARGYEGCYTRSATAVPKDSSGNAITIPVGQWSKLAVVFNQKTLTLSYYINGVCIKSNCYLYNNGTGDDNKWRVDGNPVGFTYYRMQMAKDTSYSSASEDEKNSFGMYIDNMRIYSGTVPEMLEDSVYYGTACDFEDYEEKSVSFNSYDAMYPFKDSIVMGGRCENSRSVVTEKGKSLWLLVDNSDNNDQYMDGAFTEKAVTDKVVMQFDVKPLGLGSATQFGMTGKKTDGTTTVFQRLFSVNPDGTLKIYARGKISDSSGSVSEQCYTEGAFVTLRKGNKTTYTDTEPVTIPVDKWSRLAAVYDITGKKIHYYVNGELIFSNAIPFNSGNDLNTTGITNVRIQTSKYSGYGTLTDEEKKKTGLYIDNLKVFLGSSPSELSEGYYEVRVLNEAGKEIKNKNEITDGIYKLQITARGDDTSNLQKDGIAIFAEYDSDNVFENAGYISGRVTKNRMSTLYTELSCTEGKDLSIFFWDSIDTLKPIINKISL